MQVEEYGFAWQAGLRQGSRLVEICKVAAVTLSHEQMIDLLRTSVTVKVVIIPPFEDSKPRRYGNTPLFKEVKLITKYLFAAVMNAGVEWKWAAEGDEKSLNEDRMLSTQIVQKPLFGYLPECTSERLFTWECVKRGNAQQTAMHCFKLEKGDINNKG